MPGALSQSDIDAIYNALRPRLRLLPGSGGPSYAKPLPHTHTAEDISYTAGGLISSAECQSSQEELDNEKLARSGVQPMLGDLDMYSHQIVNITNLRMNGGVGAAILNLVRTITMTGVGLIQNIRTANFSGSSVGQGIINLPRVVHMNGDDDDNEARIDGLERVVFNSEVTKSVIDNPSRLEWNTNVTPGTDYTNTLGYMSWSDLEGTMVVVVASGS